MSALQLRQFIARAIFFAIIITASRPGTAAGLLADGGLPRVEPNDNRHAAGAFDQGTVTVALRAATGRWQPEGAAGPALEIEALGEVGKALTVPAPLVRVTEGTQIVVSIRNDLAAPLVVHGLCARDGNVCPELAVPPGQTRDVRFASGRAGTYHYWASTFGAPVPFRELAGAFVVDDATRGAEADRIIVITEWSNLTPPQLREIMMADNATETFVNFHPRVTFVMNGLSWPATERFTYELGQPVKWRVINLSSQHHPLHLHGFYFAVNSMGNGLRDAPSEPPQHVVTQLLMSGSTLTMTWTPERAGNWLFHCHVMHHVSPARALGDANANAHAQHGTSAHAGHGNTPDSAMGMAGMVIGITVRDPNPAPSPVSASDARARQLTLVMKGTLGHSGAPQAAGFVLSEGNAPLASDPATAPGPAIVLAPSEPVEITVINQLTEATAIHWHGMELESYYDGVHGFSGIDRRVTPMIEPGGRFVVRFTPPRAGTFIYHTHLHDYRQLTSGLYGPLIVTNENETFDPATDQVIVLGRKGLTSEEPSVLTEASSVVINGERTPQLVWKAGARHRVRLINITPDDIFSVTLQGADGPVQWTPVAKDGAPVAAPVAGLARQTIAVGETYDFIYQAPEGRKTVWLEVRTPGGKWQAQGNVIVR